MIFIMSDIHGDYQRYVQALQIIGLKEDDTLFILGDMVDRGSGGCKILQDMMYRMNVIPLLGNHEFLAVYILSILLKDVTEDTIDQFNEDFLADAQLWLEDGGQSTFDEFKKLPGSERNDILRFMKGFDLYQEVSVNGQDYVLVHAGLENFHHEKSLDDYSAQEILFARADYEKIYFENKILITGHTPTKTITGEDKIHKANNHIAIDCGCAYGGKLGVLCLDDGREFYI